MGATELDVGLDQALRAHVQQHYVPDGRLFAMVPQSSLTADERMALLRAGWTARNFVDAPMMEPPTLEITWHDLKRRHRDLTLHRVHHRLPKDTSWAGNRVAILEEMLSSTWEGKEDEIRTLLSAWSYASVWNEPDLEREMEGGVEAFQTFFFYSQRMRDSMVRILEEGTVPPSDDDDFWMMLDALVNDEGNTP